MLPRIAVLLVLLVGASRVAGQDMPLRDFILEDERWVVIPDAFKPETRTAVSLEENHGSIAVWTDGTLVHISSRRARTRTPIETPLPNATALVLSPDKNTVYVGFARASAVWAFRVEGWGIMAPAPYCPLRKGARHGETSVSSLTADTAGRIYAATPEGIQIYDPTGRLCGVLAAPAPGTMEILGWQKNHPEMLTVWIGDTLYGRKMATKGSTP